MSQPDSTLRRTAHPERLPRLARLALPAVLIAASFGATAQQVYRHVGPDGRVTFSDQPPAAARSGAAAPARGAPGAAERGTGGGGLPYALQQVAQRYPVTLYSGKDCVPCNSGRNLLTNRGIPFTEKTVNTNADIEAFKRLAGGDTSVPLLTVGGQRLRGYSDSEWSQYLDAAGYPASSQLPRGYARAAATPLVPPTLAAPAPSAAPAPEAEAPPPPPEPSVTPSRSPSGIRF